MTRTLPGADVRAFYTALGVQLPGWAHTEASVRCFADPDAHQHQDRDPSCQVNLASGAFNCHGCGAHGGAYDAALATGRSPREAIDLMVAHALTERRARSRDTSRLTRSASASTDDATTAAENPGSRARGTDRPRPAASSPVRPASLPVARTVEPQRTLTVSGADVRNWGRALQANPWLLARVHRERGWDGEVLVELGVGFDGDRITVPITNERRALQGLLRLRVAGWQSPKVRTAFGTRLGLIPHPSLEPRQSVLLVEGPGDMLAARSAGLPAIAVPGTHAWRAEWAQLLAGREVTVVMDCDRPGRDAARRIADQLEQHHIHRRIVDLAPQRADGHDLSDWLKAGNHPRMLAAGDGASHTRSPIGKATSAHSAIGERSSPSAPAPRPTIGGPRPAAVTGGGERSLRCRMC